jgi:hypothetical protein
MIPPQIPVGLREEGYPAAELRPGEWHIFAVYAGD